METDLTYEGLLNLQESYYEKVNKFALQELQKISDLYNVHFDYVLGLTIWKINDDEYLYTEGYDFIEEFPDLMDAISSIYELFKFLQSDLNYQFISLNFNKEHKYIQ